jgi:hypothetical protein
MAKANRYFLMEIDIRVSIRKVAHMEKEDMNGVMEVIMRDNFQMV